MRKITENYEIIFLLKSLNNILILSHGSGILAHRVDLYSPPPHHGAVATLFSKKDNARQMPGGGGGGRSARLQLTEP